jgi:hypothetical protein
MRFVKARLRIDRIQAEDPKPLGQPAESRIRNKARGGVGFIHGETFA